jgi:hypothetical protein
VLTVLGGPNIYVEPERQKTWLERNKELDCYILGEGDFLATDITKHYIDAGLSPKKFGKREIPSSVFRRPDGSIARNEMYARHKEVDDIPSPWLTGIQDEFFDGKLAPMIETNRGCPFQCTYCVQGTNWYTKVHYFSLDRIKEELEYVARVVAERSPTMTMLRIADSNYGMFERDIDISAHIGKIQKEYKWPTFIDVTTGKNRPDRVIKSVEEAGGAPVLYMAVQSLDENVLRNIKRQNIKLEAYNQLQTYMRGRGMRSNSDLILCLPGESLATHTAALNKLLDSRIDQMHNMQLLLIQGSELESVETRNMFHFDSRFRLGPRNYGVYGDNKVFDIEEIVVATDTLPFEDYLTCRKYHLMCSVFWNDSWFEDGFRLTDELGIPRSTVFHKFLPAMDADRGPAKKFLDDFVRETVGELLPTAEACREYYNRPESFDALLRGDIGENLMYKYRALASFHIWKEICAVGMKVFHEALAEAGVADRIPDFENFWKDFAKFEEAKHADGPVIDEIAKPAYCTLSYDIQAWLDAGSPLDVAPYKLPEPMEFRFALNEEGEKGLRAAFAVWTAKIQGLTKLVTRIQVAWQVRAGVPAIENERVAVTAGHAD